MFCFILRSLVGAALGLTAAGLLGATGTHAGDGAFLAGCILINGAYLFWRYVRGENGSGVSVTTAETIYGRSMVDDFMERQQDRRKL